MNKYLCFLAVMAIPVFAADYYVSPAGKDSNPGTPDKPFATITFAAKKAGAGDTVKILPGLYREEIELGKKGTAAAPITFQGTRDGNGRYLTIIEAPGVTPANWQRAP